MTRNRKRNARRATAETGRHASSGFLFVSLAVIGIFLGVYLAKVWLQRRTDVLGLEWEAKSRQITQLRDEQTNLAMQKESFTDGAYILDRARQMRLEPPSPGQVRRLMAPPAELTDASQDDDEATATPAELASSEH
jgi:cell division protein FtsB